MTAPKYPSASTKILPVKGIYHVVPFGPPRGATRLPALADPTAALLGTSGAVRDLRQLIRRVARSDTATVLLTGETGTGKGLAARILHDCSPRSAGPFVNVTCTALPATLLESELFGHERGAFTDAKTRHLGLFEQACHGTLFLDEIGDMEGKLQAKLLRVLEEKRFRRLGGTEDIIADVRLVGATNIDLLEAVAAHAFREDLYYRLAVITIPIVPLRERSEDIEMLSSAFLREGPTGPRGVPLRLGPSALAAMKTHQWPGNVRELRNAIQRAMVLAEGNEICVADLPRFVPPADVPSFLLPANGLDLPAIERSLVLQAFERAEGNVTAAARLLGINRDQVRYRLQKYRESGVAFDYPPRGASMRPTSRA